MVWLATAITNLIPNLSLILVDRLVKIVIGGGHTFCAGADLKLARDVIRTSEDGGCNFSEGTTMR